MYRFQAAIVREIPGEDKPEVVSRFTSESFDHKALADPALIENFQGRLRNLFTRAKQLVFGMGADQPDTKIVSRLGAAELHRMADAIKSGKLELLDVSAYRDPQNPDILIIKSAHSTPVNTNG